MWETAPEESDFAIILVRIGFIVAFAILVNAGGATYHTRLAWIGVGLAAVYTATVVLVCRRWPTTLRRQRLGSIFIDIIMLSLVIANFGFAASGLKDLYYVVIFAAGMWYRWLGAVTVGCTTALAYVVAYSAGTGVALSPADALRLMWDTGALVMPIAGFIMGWLFKAYSTELQRLGEIEHEIGLARRLQDQLLPPTPPRVPGWEIGVVMRRAREVGGDLYAFHTFSDGSLLLALADMAGRSVYGLVHLSLIHSHIIAAASTTQDLGRLAAEVNQRAYPELQPDSYAAAVLIRLQPNADELAYANCGHLPPLLVDANADSAVQLHTGDPVIGAELEHQYREERLKARAGTVIVCYTDGIVEARDPAGETFGEERLAEFVIAHKTLSPQEMCSALIQHVQAFAGTDAPTDDQTVIVIRRLGAGPPAAPLAPEAGK